MNAQANDWTSSIRRMSCDGQPPVSSIPLPLTSEMPRAEIRVYHSSRVRLRGFVLKTTARLKSCELTVNT
jgi:hypothetical protein